ncbi:MAG TPA: hypothetical protein VJT31_23360, partial [Rugosimonospora sp.]|nr:hypothetical protein [Rugosimonospora sp.]
MDTLEWGASDRPVGAGYAPWRPVPRWLGPPVALWLGGAGVALAVTAEVLPWASAAQSSGGGSLSVDNLTGVPTLGYYLCWMGLLAAAGLVVAGRPAQRRP